MSKVSEPRVTPAMQQYFRFKKQFPDCVLLFRMGDFYELFYEDAVRVSKAIGLTLTQRTEGVPMAGVPYHQLDTYLRRLVAQGFRCAVCDQVQDPKEAKGVVERSVTRVISAGTLVDETLVEGDSGGTLGALLLFEGGAACATVELSLGEMFVEECPIDRISDWLTRERVREALLPEGDADERAREAEALCRRQGVTIVRRQAWQFRLDEAREALFKQFGVRSLQGFGLRDDEACVAPAGAIIRYLEETQTPAASEQSFGVQRSGRATLGHLRPPRKRSRGGHCELDAVSLRALEIERTIRGGSLEGSLAGVYLCEGRGGCATALGRRRVAEWLRLPLADREAIERRLDAVGQLVSERVQADRLAQELGEVQDVARIAARIAMGRATPRDIVALGASLARSPRIAEACDGAEPLRGLHDRLLGVAGNAGELAGRILASCVDSPPAHMREGGLIKDGIDAELDEARALQSGAGEWLTTYQAALIKEHDLPSLRVGYNKIFGFYIELPSAQARRAPAVFTRKQTLKNAERYITPELHAYEMKVTTAQSRAVAREQAIFEALCSAALERLDDVHGFADAVAELDALACFADRAFRYQWTRPEIDDSPVLDIRGGRHPVLERSLGQSFVPNDTRLSVNAPEGAAAPSLALITGPNMAGKSTYIRQVALITVMAHAGSFVPAEAARIGVTDRVFTRVGADDAIHAGQSTFMVEMIETATIINNSTSRSLVVLDEIGRGTGTLDGLSLAWAIVEHLAGSRERGPRTLFATHYHELTELAERSPDRVGNLHVTVREWGDDVVFLHRIESGRANRSYGIHVAKLAGLPKGILSRAGEVLESLSVEHAGVAPAKPGRRVQTIEAKPQAQMPLFTPYAPHPILEEIRRIDLDHMTPMKAFDALRTLISKL